MASGYKVNILTSSGTPSGTLVDLEDLLVKKEMFLEKQLTSCGYNVLGALGNSTVTKYSSPIQVGSLTNWRKISCGTTYNLAIKTDGTLWAWGNNTNGQLGNNTVVHYSSPIQIGSLTNWKQISSGSSSSAAVKTDGTLWVWGLNSSGQLGNGNNTKYSSPIQVGSLTNWKMVSVGDANTMAIKTDGTLWSWGDNYSGQLGTGDRTYYSSPVQVGSLTDWKLIFAGNSYFHAIKTDGSLWACGYNGHYNLGIAGSNLNYSSPVQVGSLTDWRQISCSKHGAHTLAIKNDGSLWAWGANYNGQCGITGGGEVMSPVQIGTEFNWRYVSCGTDFTMALKKDGSLWAAGNNTQGQLRDNTVNAIAPFAPILSNNIATVSSGALHNLALNSIT